MTKWLRCSLILSLLVSCTGCWSKIELDEWVFVYGIFIDVGDQPGTLKVSISTPLPNHLNNGQQSGGNTPSDKPYALTSKTADTIPDALQKIQEDMTRRLNLSEIRVIVIGKKFASLGITDLLEWIKRESSVSMGAFMLIADNISDIAQLTPVYEQAPTQVLTSFASERHMMNTTAKDCLISNAAGFGFPLTYLYSEPIPSEEQPEKMLHWAGIRGAALFNKEKMKGSLKIEEGTALAWAYGRLQNPIYSIVWDGEKSRASVLFTQATSGYEAKLEDGRPVFTIHIRGRASVSKVRDIKNRDSVHLSAVLIERLNERIGSEVERALRATQLASTDVLRLGELLEWKYPSYWQANGEDWEKIYKEGTTIKIITDFKINDFGKQTQDS
ncbi:Ger(x)C family spore germination protein [Paenibacillus sanguinis]|uniref:Ger(x)C family spore germination protein n=1 Tax=Paenibacillus sanguinis TaxID=225906 RepID=UPI000380151A|nr:Ger(x)C family spore germination protein [Paenibacillus sanguinis]